jgi:hypothetical protein
MKPIAKVIFIGAAAVVAFDALASLASLRFGFAYSSAVVGSYIIYVATGFAAGRAGGWKHGAIAGAVLGLVDGTLGWGVAWLIGPGKPPADLSFSPWMLPVAVLAVSIGAAICGGVGGAVGRLVNRATPQAA